MLCFECEPRIFKLEPKGLLLTAAPALKQLENGEKARTEEGLGTQGLVALSYSPSATASKVTGLWPLPLLRLCSSSVDCCCQSE